PLRRIALLLRASQNKRELRAGAELHGRNCTTPVDTPAKRRADESDFRDSVCSNSYRGAGNLFRALPLVLPDCRLRALRSAHVFLTPRLSPLFFAPFVQTQPLVPVRDRLDGHVLFAKGSALVGCASPPPSPLFGPGRRSALAHAVWFLVVAHRLDSFRP